MHIFIYAFTHLNISIQGTLHICMYACIYVICMKRKPHKENSNLTVSKPCKVIYFSIFIIFIVIYVDSYAYLRIYTP